MVERCIASSTNKGDFIFDPFAGSSTTGVATIGLGRKFCGVELENEFIDLSIKMLQGVIKKDQMKLLSALQTMERSEALIKLK